MITVPSKAANISSGTRRKHHIKSYYFILSLIMNFNLKLGM